MKPPKHSKESIKAHPVTSMTATGAELLAIHDARILFDLMQLKPSERLDAIGIEIICERIANLEFYQDVADSYSVSRGTLMAWLDKYPDVYARAREARADKMAEEILQIADDGRNDKTVDDEGKERVDHDVVARSRLRVDSRKWLASKMFPKRYGDKLDLTAEVTTNTLTDEQLTAKAIALAEKLGIMPKK